MQSLLHLVNAVFGFLFRPFRSVSPVYALLFFSFLTAVLVVLAFHYASDQKSIRKAKDQMQAHILAVRLFQDQLGVALRSYASIVRATLGYIRHSLAPLALVTLPVVLILSQLETRLGRVSPRPGESFLLNVRVAAGVPLDAVSLRLPPGLRTSAPSVRIVAKQEISWRVEADGDGDFVAEVVAAGPPFTKQLTVSHDLAPLPAARLQGLVRQALLNPGEPPLPPGGPLEAIEVRYRPADFELAGYRTEWWVPFLLFSFVSALALQLLTRTEF